MSEAATITAAAAAGAAAAAATAGAIKVEDKSGGGLPEGDKTPPAKGMQRPCGPPPHTNNRRRSRQVTSARLMYAFNSKHSIRRFLPFNLLGKQRLRRLVHHGAFVIVDCSRISRLGVAGAWIWVLVLVFVFGAGQWRFV